LRVGRVRPIPEFLLRPVDFVVPRIFKAKKNASDLVAGRNRRFGIVSRAFVVGIYRGISPSIRNKRTAWRRRMAGRVFLNCLARACLASQLRVNSCRPGACPPAHFSAASQWL
jgi:hypothetical protein